MRTLLVSLLLTAAGTAMAQALPSDPDSIKARCADYAMQDQVPAEELDIYLRDCLNALSEPRPEAQGPGDGEAAPPGRD